MTLKNIETYAAGRRRFVLIADSNERNRRFLSTLLKRFEYEAFAVSTVKEALEAASVVSPVLIVASRQLDAGNDALELLRSLKAANPESTAPFIVLTAAKPDPAFDRECLSAGALTCLRAPITVENFYRIIQVAIEPVPRMNIRISTNLPASINGTRKGESVEGISENGAFILTDMLHPLNTKLQVKIKLPDCVVSADAMVIYSKQANGDPNSRSGIGLVFAQISDEDQQRIRRFIRSEMAKGAHPTPPAR